MPLVELGAVEAQGDISHIYYFNALFQALFQTLFTTFDFVDRDFNLIWDKDSLCKYLQGIVQNVIDGKEICMDTIENLLTFMNIKAGFMQYLYIRRKTKIEHPKNEEEAKTLLKQLDCLFLQDEIPMDIIEFLDIDTDEKYTNALKLLTDADYRVDKTLKMARRNIEFWLRTMSDMKGFVPLPEFSYLTYVSEILNTTSRDLCDTERHRLERLLTFNRHLHIPFPRPFKPKINRQSVLWYVEFYMVNHEYRQQNYLDNIMEMFNRVLAPSEQVREESVYSYFKKGVLNEQKPEFKLNFELVWQLFLDVIKFEDSRTYEHLKALIEIKASTLERYNNCEKNGCTCEIEPQELTLNVLNSNSILLETIEESYEEKISGTSCIWCEKEYGSGFKTTTFKEFGQYIIVKHDSSRYDLLMRREIEHKILPMVEEHIKFKTTKYEAIAVVDYLGKTSAEPFITRCKRRVKIDNKQELHWVAMGANPKHNSIDKFRVTPDTHLILYSRANWI